MENKIGPFDLHFQKALQKIKEKILESDNPKLVVIFRKKAFLTDLQHVQFDGYISILLIAAKAIWKLSDDMKRRFDFVVRFDLRDSEKQPVWRDLSLTHFEGPTEFLQKLVGTSKVSSNKCFLIANEEPTLHYAARMRTKLSLAGYGKGDMSRFLDKQAMKGHAQIEDILTAPSFLLDAGMRKGVSDAEICSTILSVVHLPVFIKPQMGCALVGTREVYKESDLLLWLQFTSEESFSYVIEELQVGTEYAAYILIRDGEPIFQRFFQNRYPISDFVHKSRPLAKIQLTEEPAFHSSQLESFSHFCNDVLKKFSPPDGLFSLQAFHRSTDGRFCLIETSSRLPGGCFTSLMLKTTGISVESLHIMLQLGVDINPEILAQLNRGPFVAYIRYPRKAGTVKVLFLPPDTEIMTHVKWQVKEGDRIENARALARRHEVVTIELWHGDYSLLRNAVMQLIDTYQPLEIC